MNLVFNTIQSKLKMIRKLFHLSDIHIRLFTRHEEYNEIFEKLYKEIQKHKKDQECLIVLTGDIVHSKNDLSPELELVTFDFFNDWQNYARHSLLLVITMHC